MKFMTILIKYKYALIALALVVIIAGASVLYNSLSDEYRGDGFAEMPSGGIAEKPSAGTEGSPSDDGENEAAGTPDGDQETSTGDDASDPDSDADTDSDHEHTDGDGHDHSDGDGHDHSDSSDKQPPSVYELDFTATDEDGNTVKLSDYVGRPIVLNFWATWCPHCVEEMPEFDRAAKDNPDVTFLMLNATGTKSETLSTAKSYVEENGFEFPVLYDTSGDAVRTFGVTTFPFTLFIDAQGRIRLYASGRINYDIILNALSKITEE